MNDNRANDGPANDGGAQGVSPTHDALGGAAAAQGVDPAEQAWAAEAAGAPGKDEGGLGEGATSREGDAPEIPSAAGLGDAVDPLEDDDALRPIDNPAMAEGAAAELDKRLADADAEVEELKEKLLRSLADQENLRRRATRDVDDARRYAVSGFARDLLDVADNLSRALQAAPAEQREANKALDTLAVGVEMTAKALQSVFERHKIKRVSPQKGDKFDAKLHQAMFEAPSADLQPGTVAEVMQPGYVIADRLLRPAMVGVAKAPPAGAPGAAVDQKV